MNLGLMAVAANAGMEADRRQKVFDYEQKKRESELSLLDDRTAADRSGYQFNTAKNRVGLDVVSDPEYAKTMKTNQKEAGIRASLGLAYAENDLARLPQKLQQLATQGVLDQRGQSEVVLGTLAQLISRHDKDGALRFANEISKQPNVLPGTNGKPLADIKGVNKGDVIGKDANGNDITAQGDGYVFVNSDGQAYFNPVTTLQAAMSKLKSGEYQFIHTNDGSVYAGNKQTGAITQGHQGDTKALRSQHTPAEIQLWDRLIEKGVAKDDKQAWDMVRSAREKTRSSFVMDYMGKNSMSNQTPAQLSNLQNQAGQLYDSLKSQTTTPVATPNAAPSGSVDPQIRDLLGIPAQ